MLLLYIVSLSPTASADLKKVVFLYFERLISGEAREQHQSRSSSKLQALHNDKCFIKNPVENRR